MTLMLDSGSIETLTRSVLLGTSRHPVPVQQAFGALIEPGDPKATLKALALLAQHNRFRRPGRVAALPVKPLFADERAVVPDAARPLLRSLFAGKRGPWRGSDVIADTMERRRLKLHPFDLPLLDDFVKAYADQLGASAIAWSERNSAAPAQAYSFVDTLDESNWSLGRPAQKAAFIRSLRATEAARARRLVEQVFAREQPPVRLSLVKAMAENLSPADAPFLASLTKDRAPSIREATESLLAMLPGSPQRAKRLQDFVGRIKRTKAGLRRRTVLEFDYPATVKEEQRESWAVAMFAWMPLEDVANGLGLAVDEIVDSAASDPVLTTILAIQLSRAARFDLLARLVHERAPFAWMAMVRLDGLVFADRASAQAWSAAAIQPKRWAQFPPVAELGLLYDKFREPLPEAIAEDLLSSTVWRSRLEIDSDNPLSRDVCSTMADLVPAPLRPMLRADLMRLPPEFTSDALTIVNLLDIIETA
jgi:hypothetical protein